MFYFIFIVLGFFLGGGVVAFTFNLAKLSFSLNRKCGSEHS